MKTTWFQSSTCSEAHFWRYYLFVLRLIRLSPLLLETCSETGFLLCSETYANMALRVDFCWAGLDSEVLFNYKSFCRDLASCQHFCAPKSDGSNIGKTPSIFSYTLQYSFWLGAKNLFLKDDFLSTTCNLLFLQLCCAISNAFFHAKSSIGFVLKVL